MKDNLEWNLYKELIVKKPHLFRQDKHLEIVFDEAIVKQFEKKNNVIVGVVYKSNYHYLIVDLIKTDEQYFIFERMIPVNEGAIITVPKWKDKFVLLEQFRHAHREVQYSFPRGFGEKGIHPDDNVKKELSEEIGAIVQKIVLLGKTTSDSGVIRNIINVYFCELAEINPCLNQEGINNIILLSEKEMESWIKVGKIIDCFTISAFHLYQNNLK